MASWDIINPEEQQEALDGLMGCVEEAQPNISDGLYLRAMNHLKNINNKYSVAERNKVMMFAQSYHDECHDEIRRLFRCIAIEKEAYVRDMILKDAEIAKIQRSLNLVAEKMSDETHIWEANSLKAHHNRMWHYSLETFAKKDNENAHLRTIITELEWKLIQEIHGRPFGVRVNGNPHPLFTFDGSGAEAT